MTKREIAIPATGSRLVVLASDAPSAYGLRPDWIAVDELAEWRRRDLWDSLWSATGKRPRCRVLVISSAGWDFTSLAWEVRQNAEREADWYFSSRGQCASWVSAAWLDQQRRTLPGHVYARLHENRWVEGAGAFLTAAEVEPVFVETLPESKGKVVLGLDLGVARDRSVLAVVTSNPPEVMVESLTTWGSRGGSRVELSDVEDQVAEVARKLKAKVVLDPWQGMLLAERLRRRSIQVEEFRFTSESRRRLFGVMLDLVRAGRLKSRPHPELRKELLGLEVAETAAGWRVDHRPGQHDDHVMAVALAAQDLVQNPNRPYHFWNDPLPAERRPLEPPGMWSTNVAGHWHGPPTGSELQ